MEPEPEQPLCFGNPDEDGMNLHKLMLLVEKVVIRQIGGAVEADLRFIGRFTEMTLHIETVR